MRTKLMPRFADGETDATAMMKRAKRILQALVVLSFVSSLLIYFLIRPATYLAILGTVLFSVALALVSFLESQSKGLRQKGQWTISAEEVEMDAQYASIYTAIALFLLFMVSSVMVAATLVQAWATVGFTAAVLFMMSSLILIPYIALFLRGAAEDQRNKLAKQAMSPIPRQSTRNRRKDSKHHKISPWFLKS